MFFPSPLTANVKIQGHKVLQNKPTLVRAYTITIPLVVIPITVAMIQSVEKINNILAGFPLLAISAAIKTKITNP